MGRVAHAKRMTLFINLCYIIVIVVKENEFLFTTKSLRFAIFWEIFRKLSTKNTTKLENSSKTKILYNTVFVYIFEKKMFIIYKIMSQI